MQISFTDPYLALLYAGQIKSGKPKFPSQIVPLFQQRIQQIKNARDTNELRKIKSLHFEKLSGEYQDSYSIRLNRAYRLIFRITEDKKLEIILIDEISNHYH